MHVRQFHTIDNFIDTVQFDVPRRSPDFLIFDYQNISHEGFSELTTYRQNYFEINFEITEGCSVKVDQYELRSAKNRLTMISPHRLQSVLGHATVEGGYKGYGLFFSAEFLQSNFHSAPFLKDFPFFDPRHSPAIILNNNSTRYFSDLIGKIHYEYENFGQYSRDIIQNYLHILLLKAKENYPFPRVNLTGPTREQEIFHEFQRLVQKHFPEFSSVNQYADLLHITPKHLSETVKKVSGKSALRLIHEVRLHHAQSLLRQTGKTVVEIAYELRFENADYFSVFFKRLTGKSPVQYREEVRANILV